MSFKLRLKRLPGKIAVFFSRLCNGVGRMFSRTYARIKPLLQKAVDKMRAITSSVWKKVRVPIKSILSSIASLPWKRIMRVVLFPHMAVSILLIPMSTVLLVLALSRGDMSALAIVSYVLSFYTLVIVSLRMPELIGFIKKVKSENKYLRRYFGDPELRVRISLHLSLLINISYAVFQIVLGVVHSSLWYYSLGVYYALLSLMRFFVVRYDRREKSMGDTRDRSICITVGVMLLVMTLVLSGVILHMIVLGITIVHHEITTIAMAAYTFTALTMAIVEIARHRGERSVVFFVSKHISLVSALVSIITLENAMITAFGGEEMADFSRIMTGATGGVICAVIAIIAIIIIKNANKELQKLNISP